MKTAAVYCRVSTDAQEIEGTSLQTQLEACIRYCQTRAMKWLIASVSPTPGFPWNAPSWTELRDLVRAEAIDVVVIYCLGSIHP